MAATARGGGAMPTEPGAPRTIHAPAAPRRHSVTGCTGAFRTARWAPRAVHVTCRDVAAGASTPAGARAPPCESVGATAFRVNYAAADLRGRREKGRGPLLFSP